MTELKTKKTESSVEKFINSVRDKKRRDDAFVLLEVMKRATKMEPKMWGSAIIGFGDYVLKYPNGRELEWFYVGMSPRKQNLVIYAMGGEPSVVKLAEKLGKYTMGKGCLYINKIEDIDLKVLDKIIKEKVKLMKAKK